jgi:hypothetical protein
MERKYIAPEVKLAGDAREVVLGLGLAGPDFAAEDIFGAAEFLEDEREG